jgi:phosphinothricin acetyltransferase
MPPTIRLATPEDAEQVQGIYAPYCSTPISFESAPPGVEEVRGRLVKVLGEYSWLLCEEGGEALGYVYATRHRERAAYHWSVDTAVYVRPGRQRRGVGRALYTSLLAVLPLQGYVNAYAGVTLPNPASVGLHEAMGFRPVGVYEQVGFKRGSRHDVAWFQRPLQPRPAKPLPPRSLDQVRDMVEWAEALSGGLRLLRTTTRRGSRTGGGVARAWRPTASPARGGVGVRLGVADDLDPAVQEPLLVPHAEVLGDPNGPPVGRAGADLAGGAVPRAKEFLPPLPHAPHGSLATPGRIRWTVRAPRGWRPAAGDG